MTVSRAVRWPYLVLLAEVLAFWRGVLFSDRFAIPWDLQGYHQPLAWFVARSLARWELPLWNPYIYCGVPIYANLTAQLFYPPTLALLVLSNWVGGGRHLLYFLELEIVLHALLGGCLAFKLLRRLSASAPAALVGATVYQLGAYFATQAQHLGAIDAAAWLPLAWLAVIELADRFRWRWLAVLAAALALSFLAGFPAATAVIYGSTLLLAALLIAFRRTSWRIALWCLLAFVWSAAISAVQLLPTMELSALSVSAVRLDWVASGGGIPLAAVPTLFYPNYLGILHADAGTWPYPWSVTFAYLYCGVPALIFSFVALFRNRHAQTLAFGSMALISALWMLGDSTPAYRAIFRLLPEPLQPALYAEFAMCAFTLAVAVLSGLGAHRVLKDRRAALQAAVVSLVALDLIVFSSGRVFNTIDLKSDPGIGYDNFEGYPEVPRRLRQLVNQSVPPWRVDTINASLNWALGASLIEVPTANGNDPFALLRYMLFRTSFTGGERWGRYYEVRDPDSPFLKFLNVRYVISRAPIAAPGSLIRREDLPGNVVYENPDPLPRFVLVGRVRQASDAAAALAIIRSPGFDPRHEAAVEGGPFPNPTSGGQVRVLRYAPREVVLEVDTAGPAFLATSESYFPGWRADIDGRDQLLYATNVAFRGLPVPAGHHVLTMRFDPPILRASSLISLVGLGLLAAAFLVGSTSPSRALSWLRRARLPEIRNPGKHWRAVCAVMLGVVGLFALDALLFRTGLYTSILEPDSSTGLFELVLRREQHAQSQYGRNLVVTLGDSRFAYYPRVANQQTAATGFVFRSAGVAGTDPRAWYYMLRDLDPTRDRYRAIVLGVVDYDDEDGAYDVGDDLATLHYVAARLRLSDIIPFTFSFQDPATRWNAFRGSLLKGIVFQRDILALLSHPAKRLADVKLTNRGYEEWTYGYVDTDKNVLGLKIDWPTLTATFPPGNDALRDQVTNFVLYRPYPQTGRYGAFRRKWFGRLVDRYRGTPTKVVFVRLPRGPIPRPDNLVQKKSSSIREFAGRPGVLLVDEHAFDSLERPELFKDAFHLNNAGCSLLSVRMAQEVGKLLR